MVSHGATKLADILPLGRFFTGSKIMPEFVLPEGASDEAFGCRCARCGDGSRLKKRKMS